MSQTHTGGAATTAAPAPARPVPAANRVLAPDLARGVMLLLIALAHTYIFSNIISGEEVVLTAADRVVTAGTVMFVEFRAYPMFAALFGYGLAQIYRSRTKQGYEWPRVRTLLRRRALWMVVFGLAHVALLFFGDVLAVYGMVALVFMGMLRFSDRALKRLAIAWLPLAVLVHSGLAYVDGGFPPLPDGLLNELLYRVFAFLATATVMFLSTVVPFLIGILAARHRVLEEPHRHLRLLRTTAFVGIPLAALGGLPLALRKTGAWTDYTPLEAMFSAGLHQVSGYAGGLGYAALIALVAVALAGRQGPVTNALAALGQRSLTFYLTQSVAWALLFASYTLHLQLTSPAVGVGVAVAVWLTTVVLADLMRRRNMRGPAEVALRRLTYGPSV